MSSQMQETDKILVLGMFDGVHIGHAALFSAAKELALCKHIETIVYTFENHPTELYANTVPKLLLDTAERKAAILDCGIDSVVMDRFDSVMCSMSAEDFVRMLKERFSMKYAVVGYNYSFGKGAKGNPQILCELGRKYDFETVTVAQVLYKNEPVSSSRIRKNIESGDILDANAQLTHNFTMKGIVYRCRQVGRTIGFPTANIHNDANRPLPRFGVYATRVTYDGRVYDGVTNVGNNPTFSDCEFSVETHMFDFDDDIYGKFIEVEFIAFLREQVRFESVDALKNRIACDKQLAKQLHDALNEK